jgi:5-methylcytosine-specific restriction enzyme subunit McrC
LRRFELEAGSVRLCELEPHQAAAIRASGLVDVRLEADGRWRLIGESKVGVTAGNDWEVRVHPRIEVSQLYFLLGYSFDPNGWRDQPADFSPAHDLFEAIANGFAWHATRAIEQGVLRGYVEVEERLPGIRGRVRFANQISRSSALPLPVEVSYDDYTTDILENRILKSAAHALLRFPRVPALARRRLLQLRAGLDEVKLLERPRELQVPLATRLNERYRPALRLAELILRGRSLHGSAGASTSTGFVFDMNKIFEDFLSTALSEALQPHGGYVRTQAIAPLDLAGGVSIKPDLLWCAGGVPRAVIDAKHKELTDAGMPKAGDAYQMLAYCTALKMPRGYLVYAKDGSSPGHDLRVRNSECEIFARAVNIGQPPPTLLTEVERLVGEIVSSAGLPAARRSRAGG